MTREEFFTALTNGAKWDVGVSIARTNPLPLDANSVFESLDSLTTYATTNPLAYPGQIVSVIGTSEVAAYQLTSVGVGAVIHKLAASSASGDIEQDVMALQTSVSNIINGTTIVAEATKATQDGDGNVIADTYATKDVASATAAGLMSADDFSKLADIDAGAQVNVLEGVQLNGTDLEIVAKKVNIDLSDYATKADVTSIPKFAIQVVESLPLTDISATTVYLVAHSHAEGDGYDEYIYVNDEWEKIGNTDIDLTGYSTTEEMNTAIGDAIAALDVAAVTVGAGETVASISEADGKVSVTKQSIQIEQAQVTGLSDALAGKQAASTNLDNFDALIGTGLVKKTADGYEVDTNAYITNTALTDELNKKQDTITSENKLDGALISGSVASADKVANALTVGSKTFDGSAPVAITAADLGALTAVPAATDTVVGGILTGYVSDATHRAVQLDVETGKAFVEIPEAVTYSAGNGLAIVDNTFSVAEGGISTAMIADGAVIDAKIASVNVNKLTQTDEDTLILNGGSSTV